MARLTGRVGQALRQYRLPCESVALMSIDPYAVIDLSDAISMGDNETIAIICTRLAWLMESTGEVDTVYCGEAYPADLIADYTRGKAVIDQGSYQASYSRHWTVYADEHAVVQVLHHIHDGYSGRLEDWIVDVSNRKGQI